MHDHRQNEAYSRVRQIPIRVESRQNQPVYSHNRQHDADPNQQQQRDDRDDQCRCSQSSQQQSNQFRNNNHNAQNSPYSSQTLPNTSSININYKPESRQSRSTVETNLNIEDHGRFEDNRQHPQHSQQYHNQQHRRPEEPANVETLDDKENKNSKQDSRGASPNSDDSSKNSDKLIKSDEAIPLPPPTEQVKKEQDQPKRSNSKQQQPNQPSQPQQQQSKEPVENKKTKIDSGPLGIIASTKTEVSGLLQDIVKFSGSSLKAREYLLLDELLTRCILKLDNIQCSDLPEVRQQRKAVIELIDKCTDILQRKVQLNHDIQQLLSSC